MNRNGFLLLQDIMFCAPRWESASLVHFALNRLFLNGFSRFLFIYFIIYQSYLYEEVNIYEEYVCSMRHFALLQVNK
jgi:hypothetical protein